MPDEPRFLLGYGERLTARVDPPGGGRAPEAPYSFDQAVERLRPEVAEASSELYSLPDAACPGNEAVGIITLHPQGLAKSYHPQRLLNAYNLRQVGSRPVEVTPDEWTRQGDPEPSPSTELYVAGDRASFAQWSRDMSDSPGRVPDAIQRIEAVRAPSAADRYRHVDRAPSTSNGLLLDLVLHASAQSSEILRGFRDFADSLGFVPEFGRRVYAGGLCFLPAEVPEESLERVWEFSFLRTARPLSRLRSNPSIERATSAPGLPASPLPVDSAIDPDLRIAVFDGGIGDPSVLAPWVTSIEPDDIGDATPEGLEHGHSVTSAVLFGSLIPGVAAARPFGVVDHYRVTDSDASTNPYELYDVLRRIQSILSEHQYEFFNLSVGPYVSVQDDDVHPWTAVLDLYLSDGRAFATIAAGNNALDPGDSSDHRIQVPADTVNGFAIGAADSARDGWDRAAYSALGLGRSPGVVKPDVLEFGGSAQEPFIVYDRLPHPALALTAGTSFSAPAVLRRAAGRRVVFGDRISPLGLKSLIVHSASAGDRDRTSVGWEERQQTWTR